MAQMTDLVRRGFELNDANDVDGFVAMMASDCEWLTPEGVLRGRDEIRSYVSGFRTAFPDGHHHLDRVYEAGDDTVAVEGRWAGTQTGPLATPGGEIPATGRSVEMPFALFVTGDVAAEQARRAALYYDSMGIMAQLGLLPEPTAA
jgi:ketosteroid isomerase-like protein